MEPWGSPWRVNAGWLARGAIRGLDEMRQLRVISAACARASWSPQMVAVTRSGVRGEFGAVRGVVRRDSSLLRGRLP